MLWASASGIIVESVTLVIARMFSSTRRQRGVRTVVVLVVDLIFVGKDERLTILIFADLE